MRRDSPRSVPAPRPPFRADPRRSGSPPARSSPAPQRQPSCSFPPSSFRCSALIAGIVVWWGRTVNAGEWGGDHRRDAENARENERGNEEGDGTGGAEVQRGREEMGLGWSSPRRRTSWPEATQPGLQSNGTTHARENHCAGAALTPARNCSPPLSLSRRGDPLLTREDAG